jgi:hypothetical protein
MAMHETKLYKFDLHVHTKKNDKRHNEMPSGRLVFCEDRRVRVPAASANPKIYIGSHEPLFEKW